MHRLLLLLVLLGGAAAGDAPDAEAKARSLLTHNLQIAATGVIGKLGGGEPVAILAGRPATTADPVLVAAAGWAASMSAQAVCRAGIRAFLGEESRPLAVAYPKGRLPPVAWFGPDDAAHWKKAQQARWVLQPSVAAAKTGIVIRWQLIDLAKMQMAKDLPFPAISATLAAARPDLGILPEPNVALLLFAGGRIGQQVARGECWDLPATRMQQLGFKVPGYDFGSEVTKDEALPGDVLTIDTDGFHHVMLLVEPKPGLNGAKIYHQNVNKVRNVIFDTFPEPMRNGVKVWRPGP